MKECRVYKGLETPAIVLAAVVLDCLDHFDWNSELIAVGLFDGEELITYFFTRLDSPSRDAFPLFALSLLLHEEILRIFTV